MGSVLHGGGHELVGDVEAVQEVPAKHQGVGRGVHRVDPACTQQHTGLTNSSFPYSAAESRNSLPFREQHWQIAVSYSAAESRNSLSFREQHWQITVSYSAAKSRNSLPFRQQHNGLTDSSFSYSAVNSQNSLRFGQQHQTDR